MNSSCSFLGMGLDAKAADLVCVCLSWPGSCCLVAFEQWWDRTVEPGCVLLLASTLPSSGVAVAVLKSDLLSGGWDVV